MREVVVGTNYGAGVARCNIERIREEKEIKRQNVHIYIMCDG